MNSGSAESEPRPIAYQLARDLLLASGYTVALTGAGISTPSGIPDFRSPGSGLWEKVDPYQVASLTAFRYHPDHFFEWIRPLAMKYTHARPNPAHLALARLEQEGHLQCIVTQNIDDLHQQAGSTCVLQIHGNMQEATCGSCYRRVSSEVFRAWLQGLEPMPRCPYCGGMLKPNVILFEEQLPQRVLQEARREFRKASLVIVAGSSLEVTPAASLPLEALERGARLIIVNRYPTYLDARADAVFYGDVAEVLPRLVDEAHHVAL